MRRILGHQQSINVRKALCVADELGLEYTREDWGGAHRSTRDPQFLALNPNGLVPVLIEGDFVLWESNAIGRYLAMSVPAQSLLPTEPRARGLVEQWIDWQTTELNSAWFYAFVGLVRGRATHQDPARIRASVAAWNEQMVILERQLQRTGGFVAAREFTLADVGVGLATHRWRQSPIERADLPAVAEYYTRLCERPALRRWFDAGGP
jgi:glutathione S-transferase